MLDLNALSQLKDLKSALHEDTKFSQGTVMGSFGRYGFVQNEKERIYLSSEQMSLTLIDDTIEYSVTEVNGKQNAIVESIVKSKLKELIGKYVIKGKGHFVEALDSRIQTRIYIPETLRNKAVENDIVRIKISKHPFKSEGNTQAKITEILGNLSDAGIWHKASIAHYELNTPTDLTDDEQKQYLSTFESTVHSRKNNNQDLTHLDFFTIDSQSSKDLDDAICVEKSNDKYTLHIAIADPSALINSDDILYKQALESCTSVYLPGKTIPMLPSFISNTLCSLLPNEERLAFVVTFEFDDTFKLIDSSISSSVIQSKRQYSYDEADTLIDSDKNLSVLKEITDSFFENRSNNEIIMQQSNDYQFNLNDDLTLDKITIKPISASAKMIEECMVFSNKWIASFLNKHDLGLFISQAGLRNNAKAQAIEFLNENITDFSEEKLSEPSYFTQCFNQLTHKQQLCIQKRLDRSEVTTKSANHWAMGIEQYCTFTSPIRKVNDFINHQFLHHIINKKAKPFVDKNILAQLNSQTRNARQASNQVENQIRIDSIADDEIFDATINHATPGSIICQITSIGGQCQYNLRKVKTAFNPLDFSHTIKKTTYNLNDEVQVKITKKDSFSGILECVIIENDE
ncbi:RNB domain-containing ribonuclease [Marinicellulosiphila megalodicopiae]|uniref:RNB domain-containing ribonuclease n=1 Tax=Marinicellulosiphila megalodicopiae TaxID=2724896 RepID=UPI003BB19A5D